MSKCYKTSNNQYFNSPALMSDGRHFTDYRPNCLLNNNLKIENSLKNSYDYKLFLTQNSEKIIEINRKKSELINGSYECKQPYYQGTMLPEKELESCNLSSCNVRSNFDTGIGLGRDYKGKYQCLNGLKENPLTLEENVCK
jgi:hypothetical protein